MIDVSAASARQDRIDVMPTTLRLGAGLHALLGRKEDGVSALLACMAGDARPRGGLVRVLGADPREPRTRARIGYLPLGVRLPDALRVEEVLAVAQDLRGGDAVTAEKVLEPLGIASLARRRAGSLDAGETRAVALAEMLASKVVSVLLLEEPFVAMAPPAAAALPNLLRARDGACVVVSTASAHDASLVARDFALFDRGRLLRVVAEADAPLRTVDRARLHVEVSDARALVAQLAKDTAVVHLELRPRAVIAEGDDMTALASAVREAIIAAGVQVERIQTEIASAEMLRADAAGQLAGAYEAARARALQPQAPPPGTPGPGAGGAA